MNGNAKKSKSKSKSYSIDELPSDAVDAVLVKLPIRDAVRTSILSREWRCRWTAMTQLDFTKAGLTSDSNALFSIVNHVLMLHAGPIHSFKVATELTQLNSKVDQLTIDRWMIVLQRNGIKELVLELGSLDASYYVVHSCLFPCQDIRLLTLFGCMLKSPPFFRGFFHLSSLHLQYCDLSDGSLESLISNCPRLQKLVLVDIASSDPLILNCPMLQYLFLHGEFKFSFLLNTPVVSEVYICVENALDFHPLMDTGISNFLSVGSKPEKLPVSFERLKSLRLGTNFLLTEEISLLLSLLRRSYYLQELILMGCTYDPEHIEDNDGWKMNDEDVDVFSHLRIVKIVGFECIEPEMEFIKFLLSHAPVLQKMEISMYSGWDGSCEILIDLLRFRRASIQAEIIFLN